MVASARDEGDMAVNAAAASAAAAAEAPPPLRPPPVQAAAAAPGASRPRRQGGFGCGAGGKQCNAAAAAAATIAAVAADAQWPQERGRGCTWGLGCGIQWVFGRGRREGCGRRLRPHPHPYASASAGGGGAISLRNLRRRWKRSYAAPASTLPPSLPSCGLRGIPSHNIGPYPNHADPNARPHPPLPCPSLHSLLHSLSLSSLGPLPCLSPSLSTRCVADLGSLESGLSESPGTRTGWSTSVV
jgi:hypothetical protein